MAGFDAERVQIDPRKMRDYLLSPEHPQGGGKARFFLGLGFTRDRPWELSAELRELAAAGTVVTEVRSIHGTKFVVDGLIREAWVRTVWMLESTGEWINFVTAYPIGRKR